MILTIFQPVKVADSIWYHQGIQARKEGLKPSNCPYKPNTFGEVEWLRGFNEIRNT